jgi:hypothetical protein
MDTGFRASAQESIPPLERTFPPTEQAVLFKWLALFY